MLNSLFQGFIFGIAYVAPIGAQNLFVINIAKNSSYRYILKVIAIVIFFDILLALACFIGIGIVFNYFPPLKLILLSVGCIIITYMGIKLILKKAQIAIKGNEQLEIKQIIFTSFTIAWLNPQAIIDGTILFGSMRSSLPENSANLFIIGVCIASIIWFNIIAFISYKIIDKFRTIIKYINIICGIILVFFGMKLGYSFIKILLGKIE